MGHACACRNRITLRADGIETVLQEYCLTFANTSVVYQAESKLRAAGMHAGLRPLPPGVKSRCGLCVRLRVHRIASSVCV
jgi:hypothetical protein